MTEKIHIQLFLRRFPRCFVAGAATGAAATPGLTSATGQTGIEYGSRRQAQQVEARSTASKRRQRGGVCSSCRRLCGPLELVKLIQAATTDSLCLVCTRHKVASTVVWVRATVGK